MERVLNLLAASALLWSASMIVTPPVYSQDAQGGAAARGQTGSGSLAPGTAVNAELDKSLDSKKVKAGDAVTARTTEALKEDGKVVLPKGTKLTGHVSRASARGKGDSDSTLVLQFDRAELKGGQEMAVQLNVQALAAPPGVSPIGGDDLQGMGGAGGSAPAGGGANRTGAGAPVGGAVSGAAGTVARTTGSAAGAADSTVNSTTERAAGSGRSANASGGLNSSGQLTANSRGVFGLSGLSLSADGSASAQGSVIASSGKSVRLDSGTRLLLTTQANTSASAQP
ncbi:MAG TPA: hypothetical protein VKB24_09080 [Candidatus Acidoferrum sp.]|nr:hypothetical protein [Candidatus Acidoferrum sp.]